MGDRLECTEVWQAHHDHVTAEVPVTVPMTVPMTVTVIAPITVEMLYGYMVVALKLENADEVAR